jgi:hypothetical protein
MLNNTASAALPRMGNGRLYSFTSIGCYTLVYYVADGGCLCPACANGDNGSEASEAPDTDKQWRLIGADVYWEGPPMPCDHCGAEIESSYGDPGE